ncbi:MAG: hypothetical protein ACYDGM_09860, partial [Vulcanimicrobiaceae bacterium]
MSALLVLLIFIAFASMMYARWMPAILALPLMAVAMSIAAGVPFDHLGGVIVDGSASLAKVYVAVIFGALLGRVTLDTGIARALVNLAAEYGGERPFVLAMVLCTIVAVLFTSLSGLGAIIMVGSIVLPIMMTTGVPRRIAASLFLMAFALGFIFNIVNWQFYTQFFGVTEQSMVRYAVFLAGIDAIALVTYAIVAFHRERDYATWAVAAPKPDSPVPAWALLTPILPLLLYYTLHLDASVAFIVAAIYGVLVTRPLRAVPTLVAAAIRGIEDVAPAVLLFIGIGMLLVATKQPQFASALQPLIAGEWVRNPIAYVAIFGLASPLVLYRGPLNPFGVGIAVFTILLASHALPPVILVAAVMAVVQVQNVCDPTNTANVWIANFTGVPLADITKRTLGYQVGVATAATLLVVLGATSLFGVPAFAAAVPPALADVPGFLAPPGAAGRVAVDDDGSPLGIAAADAIVQPLAAAGLTPFRAHEQPNRRDCSNKTYAAYLRAQSSTFHLIEGTDLDIGLVLEDCGGWIVDEWHEHAVSPGAPTLDDARRLALRDVKRIRAWIAARPLRARNLFERGLAVTPRDPPTYFYTLFKTVDGYMRVYVRAG